MSKKIKIKDLIFFGLLFYPLIILATYLSLRASDYLTIAKEVVAFGFFSLTVLSVIFFIPNHFKKILFIFGYFLLSLTVFIKLSFILSYNTGISASAFYVFFESNATESTEFLHGYFNSKVLFLLLVLAAPFVFIFGFLFFSKDHFEHQINIFKIKSRKLRLFALTIGIGTFAVINWLFNEQDLFHKAVISYKEYKKFHLNKKHLLSQKINKNINDVISLDSPQTNIVIIGESLSNWNMHLYGYHRKTTPRLDAIKNDLYVFNDVISPHTHTIASLNKILTLSDFSQKNRNSNSSVVQLANAANYETYWLSNQRPLGIYETLPTLIGNAAFDSKYIATDNYDYGTYDGDLLPVLKNVLKKPSKRKTIFIHLIGTHYRYRMRYPKDFSIFDNETPISQYNSNFAHKSINEYDNAVLYNDYIVSKILNLLKEQNLNSYLVYFSDHGDDVFRKSNSVGHSEYVGTEPMYEIPFVVWFSDKYKKQHPDLLKSEKITCRKYILEDFYHTFADLSAINFKGFEPKKSIFNKKFKEKIRLIKNGIDYDKKE